MDPMSYAGPNASYAELMSKGDRLANTKPFEAASYYERALAMKPENPEPLIKKTRLNYPLTGDKTDTLHDLNLDDANRLTDLFPDDARSYAERAKILASDNMHTDAVEDLEYAVYLDSNFVNAYVMCGESYLALDKYRKAANRYMRAVRLSPDNSEAVYHLCYSLEKLKMYRRALAVLKSYLPYDKGFNFQVYRHLGRVYGHLGKMKKSYECYTRSVRLRRPGADASPSVIKRHDEIEELHKTMLSLNPLNVESFHFMGIKLSAANWDAGIDMLETSLCFESHSWVCELVGIKYMEQSDYLEAISYFERALKMGAGVDTESVYTNLIICSYTCGLHVDAMSYVKKAKTLGISNSDIEKYYTALQNMETELENNDMVLWGHTRKNI